MRWRLAGAFAAAVALIAVPAAPAVAARPQPEPRRVTTVLDARITESSGLALSAARHDVVWTINDSGSAAVVYGVSLRTGRTLGVLRFTDTGGRPADVVDTEALASASSGGRHSLLVGDIGDNRGVRDHVTIWRLPEPAAVDDSTVRAARLDVRYAGGPADAEALVMTPDGRLLVITKALLRADVYEVPQAAVRRLLAGSDSTHPVTAPRVARIPQTLVTGADAMPDGRILVRGYGSAMIYRWSGGALVADGQVALPAQQQGESIVVEPGGWAALVSSEGPLQPLWRVPISIESQAGRSTASPAPSPSPPSAAAHRTEAASAPVGLWALAIAVAGVVVAGGAMALRAARPRGRRRP
ncbi:MAG TPA: esterase-like activity of phytase family protein [Angustibacter sp.]|nr:esterase-like activity of phytase family protein [Angustibacter sp.]